jgi:hypothetical protein
MNPQTRAQLDELIATAKLYTKLSDFRAAFPHALQQLHYHGLYHTTTAHMEKMPPGAMLRNSRVQAVDTKPFPLQTLWATAQPPAKLNEADDEVQVRGDNTSDLERSGLDGRRRQHEAAQVVRGVRY